MGASKSTFLPAEPTTKDAYLTIRAFETGRMATPSATLVADAQGQSMATSWRFLLTHVATNTHFWFDMGISHDLSSYVPAIQSLHNHFKPLPSKTSITQDTESASILPSQIAHVIVSHAHWDHLSPLPASFTNANLIVGPGSAAHCTPGYPALPTSKWDSTIWDPTLRTFPLHELPSPSSLSSNTSTFWTPLGPFPHAHDFFSDSSFYLISAPGHMPGNLAALCRVLTISGEWKWVLLGGDCAHCSVFTYWPEAPFGKMPTSLFPSGCLHEDPEGAREVIRQIAALKEEMGRDLLVWFAHAEVLEGFWEL